MMDRKMVNFIKEQYPPGTRIRLNSMEDPYHPILPGTEGEVDFVDDKGQIFMKWDNGRTLPLAPGEDSFTVLPPTLTTLKLYMPLTADLYERNEYGEFDDSSTLLEDRELRGYQDQITAALAKNRVPEEAERGLMHWYDEADSVDRKVRSAVFAVEERDRQLWGVAECRVAGELSDTELETLKEYLTGQASDGWGEGFEQRDMPQNLMTDKKEVVGKYATADLAVGDYILSSKLSAVPAAENDMGFNSTMSIYELPLLSINSPKSNA